MQEQASKSYVCTDCGWITDVVPCNNCTEAYRNTLREIKDGVERPIYKVFDTAKALIHAKGSDYSDQTDWHSNFKYADSVAAPFPDTYKPYAVLIGVKLARLSQLLREGRTAYNEGVGDSMVDLMNYCALMAERYINEQGGK